MAEEYIHPNIPKNRYIYELRMEDDIVHVRKYPVIYENKEYAYFKTPGDKLLDYMPKTDIYQNSSKAIPELARRVNLVSCTCRVYCWEDPGHTKDDREKLQKTITAKKAIAEKLKQMQDELDKTQRMYNNLQERREYLQKRVFSLEKELKNLEELEGINNIEEVKVKVRETL